MSNQYKHLFWENLRFATPSHQQHFFQWPIGFLSIRHIKQPPMSNTSLTQHATPKMRTKTAKPLYWATLLLCPHTSMPATGPEQEGSTSLFVASTNPKVWQMLRERCWWMLISVANVILHGIQENRGHVDELIREVQKLPGLTNLRWATPSFEQHFFSANRSVAQKRCYCNPNWNSCWL